MADLDKATKEIFNTDSRSLAPGAVGSQLALMSVISIVTILFFNVLRPNNKIIYEPKVKYHVGNKPPPRISDSLCGWLPPLIHTKEPELVDKIGLDAVTFLRFLRLMRWLFTAVAALTCIGLIPVNVVYNLRHVDSKDRDKLSMLTIRDVHDRWLFFHVVATYLVTFIIIGFVYIHWREMVRLRHAWFRSPEYLQSFYARTLAVLHVPKKNQSDEGIKAIFESVKVPYPTTSVHVGRKVGRLPELIDYHNETVRELEQVLVKYLKGGRIGKKRPTIRTGGCCGIGGTQRDAIEFYTAKLKRTEGAIEDYRAQIDTRKAENYGFASMAAVPYAHIVAHILRGKHPKGTDITLAPNPKDIIWENMNKSDGEIARKKAMGFLWLALVCFFNTVPLLIISALANLTSLTTYVGFLDEWRTTSGTTFAIVSGVLPPAVSALFGFFLPVIMRWLSQYMGALTHSRLDRAVIARYFAFLVISQLVIFTLIGVLFNIVKEIVRQVGKKSFAEIMSSSSLSTLPDKINRTYIDQAPYWLTFFPLRGFLAIFDLAQIVNLIWISFKTHVFGRTPRDIREWTQPPEFQYAVYYSNILFMGCVGMVFAPIAPLVPLAAAVVFWISSWVYKYQLMFVFVSKVETGGRLWNVVINRLLACGVLMQLLMILTIGLQYEFKSLQWLSSCPPILFLLAFKIYINRTFDRTFRYYHPTEDELRLAKVHSERADHKGNRLEKRFGHPALHTDLFTPMLHAKMMPLLGEVYNGKIGKDEAALGEYGGQKMETQVVEGIKIAAIDQRDLEYDPALYQRDRGELDWDTKSISSFNMLNDGASHLQASKSMYYANANGSEPKLGGVSNYDRYLAQGPSHGGFDSQDIELSRIPTDHQPLLPPNQTAVYQQGGASRSSFYASDASLTSPPTMYQEGPGLREAPIRRTTGMTTDARSQAPSYTSLADAPGYFDNHQQQPFRSGTPSQMHPHQYYQQQSPVDPRTQTPPPGHRAQPSSSLSHQQHPSYSQTQQQQQQPSHQRQQSNMNMAGRGAFRGGY
ncbi:hypothetical protein EYR40_007061 [Pleurotus pulmonarius]|nr:hypothetical protein EYR36_003668 [Pleurotus pulmonarius]KAF4599955.1 hypothetical protein EYR40_007061 [Pleurotus pulmonarius]